MKIVTAAEMRAIDRITTEQYGVPSLTLMENAGTAVAEFAKKHFDFNSVCAVCGKGNNGGDGFVAARKLHEAGKQVAVIILAKSAADLRGDAAEMFKKLLVTPLWVNEEADFAKAEIQQALKADLIVDAILGTGFKPPLRGIATRAVELVNNASSAVLAVDLPSGADADSRQAEGPSAMVRADAVVTFTAPKPVHVFQCTASGPMAVAQIGSPAELVRAQAKLQQDVLTPDEIAQAFPPRPPDAHKGNFGHVLVVGGSVGKAGAAAMAGMSALRAGAGLVTVACPKSVQSAVSSFAPEIMTEPLPETAEGTISLQALGYLQRLASGKSCLAIGPGLSRNAETAELVRQLLKSTELCAVVDADGLNAFENHEKDLQAAVTTESAASRRPLVLTPHPGEMSRLTGLSIREIQHDRLQTAIDAAKKYQAIVVLKGHRTLIATPTGAVWINMTGNPGMAKGGSGDVLTGVTAAVLAPHADEIQGRNIGFDPMHDSWSEGQEIAEMTKEFLKTHDEELGSEILRKVSPKLQEFVSLMAGRLVATAVYLHGLAGDIARDLYGEESMIATGIIDCLGEAFAFCRNEARNKFAYLQR